MASKHGMVSCVVLAILFISLSAAAQAPPGDDPIQALARQVEQLSAVMADLRTELSESRRETREVREDLQRVLDRLPAAAPALLQDQAPTSQAPESAARGPEERLAELEENHALLNARIEEQNETKVESASRYRTRLSGIVLLNAFTNRGYTDDREIPGLALSGDGSADGFGVTALQSELGFETYGPTLAGARASAGLRFNFFGSPSSVGGGESRGEVRLRAAAVRLDWERTSLVAAQDIPFFSPLSPSSIASSAYPVFSYAGNLWGWSPQARVEHRLDLDEVNSVSIQAGVIRPDSGRFRQPAVAGRFAWSRQGLNDPLTLGVGGYYGQLYYSAGRSVDSWAGAVDWNVPLGDRLILSGELYRGAALGAFGGAQGRSILRSGEDPTEPRQVAGLNSIGGWMQLKIKATPTVEFHAAYGGDHPFDRDLRRFEYPGLYADVLANQGGMFNVIYKPRTDLLFSLEYRQMKTERISGGNEAAGHLNLGVGVLF